MHHSNTASRSGMSFKRDYLFVSQYQKGKVFKEGYPYENNFSFYAVW